TASSQKRKSRMSRKRLARIGEPTAGSGITLQDDGMYHKPAYWPRHPSGIAMAASSLTHSGPECSAALEHIPSAPCDNSPSEPTKNKARHGLNPRAAAVIHKGRNGQH